jgi:hypothetical protein
MCLNRNVLTANKKVRYGCVDPLPLAGNVAEVVLVLVLVLALAGAGSMCRLS